jgi:hypothetical protein
MDSETFGTGSYIQIGMGCVLLVAAGLFTGNSFAAELAPLTRRYFTSATQNNDQDIYEKGYVGSDDVTEYDRILESLLKDKMVGRRCLSQKN